MALHRDAATHPLQPGSRSPPSSPGSLPFRTTATGASSGPSVSPFAGPRHDIAINFGELRGLSPGDCNDHTRSNRRGTLRWINPQRSGPAPRLLDRGDWYGQSKGRFNIRRKNASGSTRRLRRHDVFHSLVNMSLGKLFLICVGIIIASWLFFAWLFLLVSHQCGLGANTYLKALYLSVETVETIGYGVKDSYFNSCHVGIFVLGASGLWESLVTAVFISLIYTRISRAQSRAGTVCFTDKAIVAMIDGNCYFMFQVCDIRKHQMIEAHVRTYTIQHALASAGVAFQGRAMRLQHPDDELGGMLLMALPQLVVHRIDDWSPLCPEEYRRCSGDGRTPAGSFAFPDILQRSADGENGNRDANLQANQPSASSPHKIDPACVLRHIGSKELEVIVLVEGIDPTTSSTLQARHSYNYDDIVCNASFQRCVQQTDDGACEIDFDAFHELVPHDEDKELVVQSMA